jgi:hypothetical protein
MQTYFQNKQSKKGWRKGSRGRALALQQTWSTEFKTKYWNLTHPEERKISSCLAAFKLAHEPFPIFRFKLEMISSWPWVSRTSPPTENPSLVLLFLWSLAETKTVPVAHLQLQFVELPWDLIHRGMYQPPLLSKFISCFMWVNLLFYWLFQFCFSE